MPCRAASPASLPPAVADATKRIPSAERRSALPSTIGSKRLRADRTREIIAGSPAARSRPARGPGPRSRPGAAPRSASRRAPSPAARRRGSPWPPFSTKTAITICGSSIGAKPMNQAWSAYTPFAARPDSFPTTCAVPVLPAGLDAPDAGPEGRAARLVHDRPHAVLHDRELVGRERRARLRLDLVAQPRCPSGPPATRGRDAASGGGRPREARRGPARAASSSRERGPARSRPRSSRSDTSARAASSAPILPTAPGRPSRTGGRRRSARRSRSSCEISAMRSIPRRRPRL